MTTKQMIVEAAEKEFIRSGYEKTTLRKIASDCHITATAVYRHFKNKEEVFQSVVEPLIARLKVLAEETEKADYDLLFSSDVERVWEFEEDDKRLFELFFGEYRPLVALVLKERRQWLKNTILQSEYSATKKYLDKMKELGYSINDYDETAFKAVMDSYLEAYLYAFELNLDEESSLRLCKAIGEFYRAGFRHLLGF